MKTKKIKTSILKHAWDLISRGVPHEEVCQKLKLDYDELSDQLETWLEKQDAKESEKELAERRIIAVATPPKEDHYD